MCKGLKCRYRRNNKKSEIMSPARISSHTFRKGRCAKKITKENRFSNFLNMKQSNTAMQGSSKVYKLTLSGLFIAFGTLTGSVFYIPFLGGKMFPVQHFLNVVAAIVLGPFYGVANAFCISLLRNILGTGSILAFPGSMVGALLAGVVYKRFKNIYLTAVGEFIGTGILGAFIAYPMATLILGKKVAALAYVFPFSLSCAGGAIIAVVFLSVPVIRKTLKREAQ